MQWANKLWANQGLLYGQFLIRDRSTVCFVNGFATWQRAVNHVGASESVVNELSAIRVV